MEAPRSNKKKIYIIGGVTFAIVVAIVIAVAVTVGRKTTVAKQEPLPPPPTQKLNLAPKVLAANPNQESVDGHWNFVMTGTGRKPLEEVFHDFETKPGTPWNITGNFSNVGVFSMKCTKEVLMRDAMPLPHMRSNVLYVEPVYKVKTNRPTNLWGLDRIDGSSPQGNQEYNVPGDLNGAGVTVYVVDTGIRADHEQFAGRMADGADFIGDGQGTNDCNGHGTHCAGTVAGTTFGVANGARVAPVRVLGCDGSGTVDGLIQGIDWITSNAQKPAVASMSLGAGFSVAMNEAIQRSFDSGISFAVAAGNSNEDACNTSPASAGNAITVAASDINDNRASFSNFGNCVDLFAPGVDIVSAGIDSPTASVSLSGTSMATPHVAGVMALFLQKNPGASPSEVNDAIINGAHENKINDARSVNKLLNVDFLNNNAPQPAPEPAPQPAPEPAPEPAPQPGHGGRITETGFLSERGEVRYHPAQGFRTDGQRSMTANLEGPWYADFDLTILQLFGDQWIPIFENNFPGSNVAFSINTGPGAYVWRVSNFDGSQGEYTITYTAD